MSLAMVPVHAGLPTLLFVVPGFRVVTRRRSARVGLGDGGDGILGRRVRAHGNLAEHVPLAFLLMALAELQGASAWTWHMIGTSLIAGRLLHAWGVGREPEILNLRVAGMVLTFFALITGALANLGMAGLASG